MIPADLLSQHILLSSSVEKLLDFLKKRLEADLQPINPINILGRPKATPSILQKLHTGRYPTISELYDLAGITVVVLHRRDIRLAIDIVKRSGLQIIKEDIPCIDATDFRYREPKLYIQPPPDYLSRNSDLSEFLCEVQFTSALQHALNKTTHDFDYKGSSFSWSNFRLVARLRGMLELIDSLIDEIETVSVSQHDIIDIPPRLTHSQSVLEILRTFFPPERMPGDQRRFADTVTSWSMAIGLSPDAVRVVIQSSADLVNASSLDPSSAVLGALIRAHGPDLLSNYEGHFLISKELETLCSEVSIVPLERRVELNWRFDSGDIS
ncbi:hypothetical protein E3G67_000561 [Mycobacteroides abscessus]|nr:hypothetical protein [Mycobacteroides abscessus]